MSWLRWLHHHDGYLVRYIRQEDVDVDVAPLHKAHEAGILLNDLGLWFTPCIRWTAAFGTSGTLSTPLAPEATGARALQRCHC